MSLDPQSEAVVNALNATGLLPFRQHTPATVREKVLALRVARPAQSAYPMASVTEETITTPDGSFRVRILVPRTGAPKPAPMPAFIYFHGGGFFAGGIDETDELVRRIATGAGCIAINVDYHLSPEAKFPVAVNDAWASLCWVVENASRLGLDPGRIVLAGDSAGGNLTLVTSLMARERAGPKLAFQLAIYPSTDLRPGARTASRQKWGQGGYILDNGDIEWMLDHYLNSSGEGNDWRASPILAPDVSALPPALIITAGHDPLMDEGAHYAQRLNAAGVPAEHVCFEGTFHGFIGYAGIIDTATRAIDLICDRLRRALAPDQTRT